MTTFVMSFVFPPSAVDWFLESGWWLERRVLEPLLSPVEPYVYAGLRSVVPRSLHDSVAGFLAAETSPHSEHLPLMNPIHVFALMVLYWTVVFGGSWVMRTVVRKPFRPKLLASAHNLFLVWLSAYMCWHAAYQAWFVRGYSLFGNEREHGLESMELSKHLWLHYYSKTFEFMDTFLMVIKMNFHQISFLHVYHHTSIFAFWWFIMHVGPYGEPYFCSMLNSLVHVVMYAYYFSASANVGRSVMARVKPYITIMQMTQFCCMLVQTVYNHVQVGWLLEEEKKQDAYPLYVSQMQFAYMWSMLALFGNFYRQSYVNNNKKKKEEEGTNIAKLKAKKKN